VRDQRSVCRPTRPNPFDVILDRLTGSDPSVTDYVFEQLAKCPNCRCDILEKTLVEPALLECDADYGAFVKQWLRFS
jgi:hypothetical protein